MKVTRYLLFVFLLLASASCARKPKQKTIHWDKNKSIAMNKSIAQREKLNILMYLENRKSLKMKQTGSGLYYHVYQTTTGDSAKAGMLAGVHYVITFLNGDTCYYTPKDELVNFKIDKSEIESGVQEGVKKMRLGEKALFIIPSHLAHGVTGDQNKIPPLTPIVVDIELVSLK